MNPNLKPFQKGQSGNPGGRPKGLKHRATAILEALMDGEGEEVARKCIDLAKGGDTVCIRIVMERLLPPRKDRPIEIELPKLEKPSDAVSVMGSIFNAVASGEITPSEAGELSRMIEGFTRAYEVQELESRLSRLEAGAKR
ncbi:MAG: DUF5681 domain-containing protein [Alsobacter sp.]